MKKLLISCVLLLTIFYSNAQFSMTLIGVGYNASFVNPKTANLVLQRYDETRPWLSDGMGQIKFMDGINWNLQWISEIYILDFSFNKKVNIRSASGDNGSGIVQRDLKFKSSTFSLGMGLNLSDNSPYLGIGLSIDAYSSNFYSRTGFENEISDLDFEEFDNQLMLGCSFWSQIVLCTKGDFGVGFFIRPYYHLDFLGRNYQWLNEEINPNTAEYDTFDPYGKMNHFGIQITAVIFGEN